MKSIRLFLALAILLPALACNGQTKKPQTAAVNKSKIEVIYFHYTARCMTCNAVEAEAKKDIAELFPAEMKNGSITFQSLNLDEKAVEAKADKLKVSGQALVILKGGKVIDITNEAFLYARNKPEKLKEIIQLKIK